MQIIPSQVNTYFQVVELRLVYIPLLAGMRAQRNETVKELVQSRDKLRITRVFTTATYHVFTVPLTIV